MAEIHTHDDFFASLGIDTPLKPIDFISDTKTLATRLEALHARLHEDTYRGLRAYHVRSEHSGALLTAQLMQCVPYLRHLHARAGIACSTGAVDPSFFVMVKNALGAASEVLDGAVDPATNCLRKDAEVDCDVIWTVAGCLRMARAILFEAATAPLVEHEEPHRPIGTDEAAPLNGQIAGSAVGQGDCASSVVVHPPSATASAPRIGVVIELDLAGACATIDGAVIDLGSLARARLLDLLFRNSPSWTKGSVIARNCKISDSHQLVAEIRKRLPQIGALIESSREGYRFREGTVVRASKPAA